MKNDDFEMKRVILGYYKNIKDSGIISNGSCVHRLERVVYGEKECIIFNGYAYDKEGNMYEIIKRNKYNQILKEQCIKEGVIYALDVYELSKNIKLKLK